MADNALAYGFTAFRHLAAQRVNELGTVSTFDMIEQSLVEHTRQMNAIFRWGIERTELHRKRHFLTSDGTLQPLDEHGIPLVVDEEGSFTVDLPIQRAGTSLGDTLEARALMTLAELNRKVVAALRRDGDWIRRHFLAAIFSNVTWEFDDPQYSTLTIQGMANADGTAYPVVGGGTEDSQHYLAQSGAIDDSANPYPGIYTQLRVHPSNDGPFVAYIATDLVATTKALTDFVAITDPDLLLGNASTRIGASPGLIEQVRSFGDEVLGKVANVWIVEWKALPSTYIIAQAQGAEAPIGMREQPSASLKGFFQTQGQTDGNLKQTDFRRIAGFGAWNRIAVVVKRIGNGSYAIPNDFAPPIG